MADRLERTWHIKRTETGWPAQLDRYLDSPPDALFALGNRLLLAETSCTAFFSSNGGPGHAAIAALDWARGMAIAGRIVISGFHSPLEQSVLKILLHGKQPIIWIIARDLNAAKIPADMRQYAEQGRMLILSIEATTRQLTADAAYRRNLIAAAFADDVVCAYAKPDGATARLIDAMKKLGKACTQLVEFEEVKHNERGLDR